MIRKNIQALKGMPDSQLLPVMHIVRTSLRVRCDYCHVAENGKYWMDDKAAKQTARKMLQMVDLPGLQRHHWLDKNSRRATRDEQRRGRAHQATGRSLQRDQKPSTDQTTEPLIRAHNCLTETKLLNRLHDHANVWGVVVENTFETESSVIAFGSRDNRPVVLKTIKRIGDEWNSGEILQAFAGNGMVRVYEHAPGAVLMERLMPGKSLVEMALNGRDEEATDILADVIQRMAAVESPTPVSVRSQETKPTKCATVQGWAKGFDRFIATRNEQIPMRLVEVAHRLYSDLCASQRAPRLLHGDLHHYNVLFDLERGWLAIDPKGVIGEVEYELGAVLRNPFERPDLFASRPTIERRLEQFNCILKLDLERALAWAFAQAVLSAIWDIEDGFKVDATNPALRLAQFMEPMLGAAD